MNLNKHLEFINPTTYTKPIHIIGVGAIGSRVAEMLFRLGFINLCLYDFDTVEDYNITNQIYTVDDIGKAKTLAMTEHLTAINPLGKLTVFGRYEKQRLNGTVFLCVDSINLRRKIAEENVTNQEIDIMFDIRMRLTDAQGYSARWNDYKEVEAFINSMSFDDSEDSAPVSVCGTTLSVMPTVMTIVSAQVSNFMHYVQGNPTKQIIFIDTMLFTIQALSFKN